MTVVVSANCCCAGARHNRGFNDEPETERSSIFVRPRRATTPEFVLTYLFKGTLENFTISRTRRDATLQSDEMTSLEENSALTTLKITALFQQGQSRTYKYLAFPKQFKAAHNAGD